MALLELRDVTKYFGGLAAVRQLSFDVHQGQIVSVIGPNGAGKTTLLNLISSTFPPSSGSIKFDGQSILSHKPHTTCQRGIARTFQIVRPFLNLTVLQNVMIGAFCHNPSRRLAIEEARRVLEFVGLFQYESHLARNLTLVMKKKLEIARSLATQARLILLDEVFAGLNPQETEESMVTVRRLFQRGVQATICVEHNMKAVMAISERIIVLNHGEKIAEGTPHEIVNNDIVIETYLGKSYAQS